MRGYVVDKDGKPIQFRVHDPSTGQTSMSLLVVRGGAVSMVDVLPGQFNPQQVQHAPQPGNRVGAMEGEMGAGVRENGVVVADQAKPTGRIAPPTPTQATNGQQQGTEQGTEGNGAQAAAGGTDPVLSGAAADL